MRRFIKPASRSIAAIFENLDTLPGKFLKRYKGRPEFDESFFKIS